MHIAMSTCVVTGNEECGDQGPVGFRTLEGVEPMGRGRAKAKQVKVARQLKYSGGGTDLDRLRAELGVDSDQHGANGDSAYADLGDRYSADDDSDHAPDDDDDDTESGDDYGSYDADGLVRQSGSSDA